MSDILYGILAVVILIILFEGDPDLFDALESKRDAFITETLQ